MFKQFDIVKLKTTKRVTWKSSPQGSDITPDGEWSVIGSIGVELVLCKEGSIIRIPFEDVEKVANYDLNQFFKKDKLKENKDGKERQER